mgnify:CR=1 FL=1|tara:strand:- start:3363 stop:4196 length:834 start_codon:yes stop_codon:yes gene_type:complete
MGLLDDIAKIALPAAASYFLPGIGSTLFGGAAASSMFANPAVQQALVSGGLGLLTGQKPKDALKSALLGGIGSSMFGQAGQAPNQSAAGMEAVNAPFTPMSGSQSPSAGAAAARAARAAGTGASQAIEPIAAKTMTGELLQGLGMAGESGKENLLFKILNSQLGEGAAAGLLAELLASGDKDEDTRTSFEKNPYAGGRNYGQMGGINYNQGGLASYPRRDGGINPSEGSGTQDDVPALLTAGEFVMTRDAVEGAGGGDVNQGINRMYSMMDKFERMA